MDWLALLTFENVEMVAGKAFASDMFRFASTFTLAAYIHGAQVKKAIRELTAVVREDLDQQSKRLVTVEKNMVEFKNRIEKLEGE